MSSRPRRTCEPALRAMKRIMPGLVAVPCTVKVMGAVKVAVRAVMAGAMWSVVRTRLRAAHARENG